MASRRSHAPTDNQQIEYELWVPRRGTNTSRMMLRMIVGPASRNQERVGRIVYPTAALLRSLLWVSDGYVSPRDTAQYKVTYYTALIDVLLWEGAWLRRDAIASYVCFVCCVNSCLSVEEDVLYLVSFSVFVPTFTM